MNLVRPSAAAPPQVEVRRGTWLAWTVLCACLIVTTLGAFHMKGEAEALAQRQFAFACQQIRARIDERLEDHEQILRSGAALFQTLDSVTREQWHTFIEHLNLEQQYPGIQGIGFALSIPPEELAEHIREFRLQGFPTYRPWPEGNRESYSSTLYLEPFSDRNLRAFGYDMLSDSVRKRAMEQARDQGTATISGRVRLVQETEEDVQAGTLMYFPLYRKGSPTDTVEQRRMALRGWIFSPYRMNDLMRGILGGWDLYEGKSIRLEVFDGVGLSRHTLLYDSGATGGKEMETSSRATLQLPVDFNGRRWTLRFTEAADAPSFVEYSRAWLVLIGGLAISLLLFSLLRSLIDTSFKARVIAGHLTVDLRESEAFTKAVLDSLHDNICVLDDQGTIIAVNDSWQQFAEENGAGNALPDTPFYVGTRYLAFAGNRMGGEDDEGAQAAFDGISAVLNGERQDFSLEYPCHAPDKERWFRMSVSALRGARRGLVISHSNISDRKRTEDSIAALALRYQTLLQNAEDGIHVLDEQGNVVEVNNAFCGMLGFTREEVLRLNVSDWDVQWSREELLAKNRGLMSGKAVFETRYRRKDGGILHVEVSGVGVELQGRPHLYASARDLTERRRAEAALRESEEKYRVLFHNELYAICIFDLQTYRFLDANDAHLQLYGYTREELLGGMTVHQLTAQPGESDRSIQQAASGETVHVPSRFHRKMDGTVFPAEIVGGPYTWQGRRVMFALVRDVTERRRVEEALRESKRAYDEMVARVPVGIYKYRTKADGGKAFEYVSPRWCEIMGIACEEALRDTKALFDKVHPDDLQDFLNANETARKTGRDFQWEGRFVINGEARYMRMESRPEKLENGDIIWTGTQNDVTDEKRLEAERIELDHQLQQAKKVESLGRMAGAVAHHFNNILGVVMGNLELAMSDPCDAAESRAYVAKAMDASGRAAEMSRIMLTYLGQTNRERELLDLAEAAREAQLLLLASVPANIRLECELPSRGPIVRADEVQIKQILTNLVSNAVEALAEKGGRITVTVEVTTAEKIKESRYFPMAWKPEPRSYACLSVSDTGPGMDAATVERIFDPFFTTRFTGRGMGLPVVLGVVRAHEGGISVRSEVLIGTTFEIFLPMTTRQPEPL